MVDVWLLRGVAWRRVKRVSALSLSKKDVFLLCRKSQFVVIYFAHKASLELSIFAALWIVKQFGFILKFKLMQPTSEKGKFFDKQIEY